MPRSPRVLNESRDHLGPNAVYVDRRTKWGNPFRIGRDGNRDDVIQKHREWLICQKELMNALHELIGKDLVCHCAPKKCHADFLLELVALRAGGVTGGRDGN
jgi:hypothetical protein